MYLFQREEGWRSGDCTRLPPSWEWVKLVVGSLLCSERFFSGFSGFPFSSNINISKFHFDRMQDLPENHFDVSGASWVNINNNNNDNNKNKNKKKKWNMSYFIIKCVVVSKRLSFDWSGFQDLDLLSHTLSRFFFVVYFSLLSTQPSKRFVKLKTVLLSNWKKLVLVKNLNALLLLSSKESYAVIWAASLHVKVYSVTP